jgi:hypothetical protein
MNPENTQRRPKEVERDINQVSDIDLARDMAETEKPIRDLSRDREAAPEIQKLKPQLDKEAMRLSAKEEVSKEKLLQSPITDIILLNDKDTEDFYRRMNYANSMLGHDVETIKDLTELDFWQLQYILTKRYKQIALEIENWLKERGLKLQTSSKASDRKNRNK